MFRLRLFLLLYLLSLTFPPSSLAFDLEGKVRLVSPPPPPVWLDVPKNHQADCGAKKLSPKLQISPEGFVANAVVRLEGNFPNAGADSSKEKFTLDQIGCEFRPHIVLIPKGARLTLLNSDGFLHNVRAFDENVEMLFNDAMPKKGQVLEKHFAKPGRYILRCGVHHWMHAIVIVREHPYYALTDEGGHFKISGIPAGTYKLTVWHEELGEIHREVGLSTGFLVLTYEAKLDKL